MPRMLLASIVLVVVWAQPANTAQEALDAEPGSGATQPERAEPGSEAAGPQVEAEAEAEPRPAEPDRPASSEAIPSDAASSSMDGESQSVSGPLVHVAAPEEFRVRLHRLGPGPQGEIDGSVRGMPFSTVCHAPCDRVVDARGQTFLVAAPELMPSRDFTLDDYEGPVTIAVRPGRRSVRFAGFGVTVAGAILVPLGILVLSTAGQRQGGVAGGASLIGVGGASLGTGIALLLVGRTRVAIEGRRRGPGLLDRAPVAY
jgi:hypothetical protein